MKCPLVMSRVSVVIASVNGLPWIDGCLSALEVQLRTFDAEVIVVDCCQDGAAEHIRRNFPEVKLLHLSDRLSIPKLRAIGLSHASGDIIAFIKDVCIVSEDWAHQVLREHRSGYLAVGGAVENGAIERITDWAAYFCEYSQAMLPLPYGEVNAITGANVSYKREALELVPEWTRSNCWEYFIHEELRKVGVKFLSAPSVVVQLTKELGFVHFISQRFHYSRSFAAMRVAGASRAKRLFYILSTPFVPVLMAWRISRRLLQKKRHYREFFLSFPLLAVFLCGYACGELAGYAFGPGKSLEKVE